MNETKIDVPAVIEAPVPALTQSLFMDLAAFENGQRMATLLSKSSLIPDNYRNNLSDCVIALELAQRIGCSPMSVMQATYVVHGKPGFAATFIIAMVNSCGRYSPLRFRITGEGDKQTCVAWAYDLATSEELEGAPVSIEMAKAEGWYGKKGSKWQTMPELMLRYRAATFFGRMYAPDLLMGMGTVEELRDVPPENNQQRNTAAEFKQILEEQQPLNAPDTIDQDVSETVEHLDDDFYNTEWKKINKLTSTIEVDKWRLNNQPRIERETDRVTHDKVMEYAAQVYSHFQSEEAEAAA